MSLYLMDENSVNQSLLKELYTEDAGARALFDHLALRTNNFREITVRRTTYNLNNEGADVSRWDVIRLFRELQDAKCGRFVAGRKGHESRFEWWVAMTDVGKLASGQETVIEQIDLDAAETEVDEADEDGDDEVDQRAAHTYRLRPDLVVEISLPLDLTLGEANRLAEFIKTLPFE